MDATMRYIRPEIQLYQATRPIQLHRICCREQPDKATEICKELALATYYSRKPGNIQFHSP